ncbi:MAG: Ribonuclease, partial [Pseudomonadota bacterium]
MPSPKSSTKPPKLVESAKSAVKSVKSKSKSLSKNLIKAEQVALSWDAPGLMAGVDEAGRGPLAGPV